MSEATENIAALQDQSTEPIDHDLPQSVAAVAGVPLAADSENSDADSTLGESVQGSDSTSLASSIRNYVYENGRRYHAYREGEYILPNDETEQDRLDMLHHIFRMILSGGLYRAPIAEGCAPPQRILDLGTGTGLWAIEIADEFPDAVIIGTDLSPIQPGWTPPNCKFYVDDIESEWGYRSDEFFDYIHGRALCGSIADWPKFFAQGYQNLKAGGWLEMQEYQTEVFSDDDTIKCATWLVDWVNEMEAASIKFGKRLKTANQHKQWIQEAGFIDVHEEIYKVPIGPWAKGSKLKELGIYYRAQFLEAVEPFTMALYTRVLGYTSEQAQVVLAGVKNDLRDPKLHLYVHFHFVYGRKPENE